MPLPAYPATLPTASGTHTLQWPDVRRGHAPEGGGLYAVAYEGHAFAGQGEVTLILSADEAAIFRAWFTGDLLHGGSWFTAGWANPFGEVVLEWLFSPRQPPRWQLAAGQVWRVQAAVQARRPAPAGATFAAP